MFTSVLHCIDQPSLLSRGRAVSLSVREGCWWFRPLTAPHTSGLRGVLLALIVIAALHVSRSWAQCLHTHEILAPARRLDMAALTAGSLYRNPVMLHARAYT